MRQETRHSNGGPEASQPRSRDAAAVWLSWAARQIAAADLRSARLDAELLLAHALEADRLAVLAGLRDPVPPAAALRFQALVERRAAGEPVAYITGRRAFWDFEVQTTPAALIPRPETEVLVELALAHLGPQAHQVADIGTGTGCVILALLRERAQLTGFATDRSQAALDLARRNAAALGLERRIQFLRGDLLAPLRELGLQASLDLIVSNPPYCDPAQHAELESGVRDYEPRSALLAAEGGLGFHRRLIEESGGLLRAGGLLAIEIGAGQLGAVRDLAAACGGWRWLEAADDLQGHPRAVALQWRMESS
ncbi:MAG TPA: peptide chain release factor N(5)-glutamine methyltransferase [Acidobacteriota bacterium]